MDKYTAASIGPHVVLLNSESKTALFSKVKIENNMRAGEVTIDGERYIIITYDNNLFDPFSRMSDAIHRFTEVIPKYVIQMSGESGASVKLNDNKYINLVNGYTYFIYGDTVYLTKEFRVLYEPAYYNITRETYAGDYLKFKDLPCRVKYIERYYFTDFKNAGLQTLTVNGALYFTASEYIENMPDHESSQPIIVGTGKDYYYIGVENKNVFIVEITTNKKIELTKNIMQAARPPGFGAIYKLPEQHDIKSGVNRYGNIIITSAYNVGIVDLYSAVGTQKEVLFYIQYNRVNIIYHKYLPSKTTKAAYSGDP